MILRILVLFSSPFSSWEIPKYQFLAQILILLSMLWPSMTIKWSSHTLGASDIKWPVASSGQWWCPTLSECHRWPCVSHPARKFQGIPGQFSWAALERIEGIPCKTGGFTGPSAETNIDLVTSKLGGLWSHGYTKPLLTGVVPSQLSHHGS